jgi:hypothetical protein
MALVLVACLAVVWLQAAPARADVVVQIYSGVPAGTNTGGDTLNFAGLPQIASFNYFGPNFGMDAQAGGTTNNWTPLFFNGGQNFSARFLGEINVANTGIYTFSTRSDDGSVLHIDGKPVVLNNFDQGPTTRTGQVLLAAGVHQVELQYYQKGGGRSVEMGSGVSTNMLPAGITWVAHNTVPQMMTKVWNDAPGVAAMGDAGRTFNVNTGAFNNTFNNPVAGTFLSSNIRYNFDTGSLFSPFNVQVNYAVQIIGKLLVSADGTYTFGLNSDDGMWLFIDGNLIVNDGGFHGANPSLTPQVTGMDTLTAGLHDFEVRGFQGGGGAGFDLYLPPGVTYATPNQIAPPPPPPPPPPTQGGEIPEPATLALLALGMAGCFAASNWRRRRKAA